MRADDPDALLWVELGAHDVRTVLRARDSVELNIPVRVWGGMANEHDERQPGIPPGAEHVRMVGTYLKCDSPVGSERASSRVECPFGWAGSIVAVKERVYVAPPDFSQPSDGNVVDHRGRPRVVGYAASMDPDSVRVAEDYGVRARSASRMPRWAVRLLLRVTGVSVRQIVGVWHWTVTVVGFPAPTRALPEKEASAS